MDVFKLFKVKWKYDPVLSFKKMQYYYETENNDDELKDYLACLQ
jgi:hypothetical protein